MNLVSAEAGCQSEIHMDLNKAVSRKAPHSVDFLPVCVRLLRRDVTTLYDMPTAYRGQELATVRSCLD